MKLIKIPYSQSGTELAPEKVLSQLSKNLSEDGILPIFEIDEIKVIITNSEETNNNIYNQAKEILEQNIKPLFLGGDHSITLPIMKAFREIYPQNPGIIIFDAHCDSLNDEDLIPYLAKIIKKENVILVGNRTWNKDEFEFIKSNKIKYFSMKEIAQEGIHEISDAIMSVAKNFKDLYISIDIDVLDPAFAPGTGCQEPGGLTTRELLFFLHRLKRLKNIKAYDLVEINPKKDIDNITSKVGAKILVELC